MPAGMYRLEVLTIGSSGVLASSGCSCHFCQVGGIHASFNWQPYAVPCILIPQKHRACISNVALQPHSPCSALHACTLNNCSCPPLLDQPCKSRIRCNNTDVVTAATITGQQAHACIDCSSTKPQKHFQQLQSSTCHWLACTWRHSSAEKHGPHPGPQRHI